MSEAEMKPVMKELERPECFGMDGKPIPFEEGIQLLRDVEKRTVAKTQVGNHLVSTMLLVFDGGYDVRPLIFETMVFPCDNEGNVENWSDEDRYRWSMLDEAKAGHAKVVAELKRTASGAPRAHD